MAAKFIWEGGDIKTTAASVHMADKSGNRIKGTGGRETVNLFVRKVGDNFNWAARYAPGGGLSPVIRQGTSGSLADAQRAAERAVPSMAASSDFRASLGGRSVPVEYGPATGGITGPVAAGGSGASPSPGAGGGAGGGGLGR